VGEVEVHNLGRAGSSRPRCAPSSSTRGLALRPDLAIVAAGGNDALSEAFDPEVVDRELDASSARCAPRAPTCS
jgi:hypothetical protein